jgi:hypothetical protein
MKSTHTVEGKVLGIYRLDNSPSGNPRYKVLITNGETGFTGLTELVTKPNSSVAYEIGDFVVNKEVTVKYHVTAQRRDCVIDKFQLMSAI